MLRSFQRLVLVFTWLIATGANAAPGTDQGQLRQVAGILEYIAGDCRQAVSDAGEVLQPSEYDEQRSLAAEADALAAEGGLRADDPVRQQLAKLGRALTQKRPPA